MADVRTLFNSKIPFCTNYNKQTGRWDRWFEHLCSVIVVIHTQSIRFHFLYRNHLYCESPRLQCEIFWHSEFRFAVHTAINGHDGAYWFIPFYVAIASRCKFCINFMPIALLEIVIFKIYWVEKQSSLFHMQMSIYFFAWNCFWIPTLDFL